MLFVLLFRTTTNLKCFEKKDLPKFNSAIITAEEREIEAVFNNLLPVENFANVRSVSSDDILQSEVMQSSQFSLMEEKTHFPAVSNRTCFQTFLTVTNISKLSCYTFCWILSIHFTVRIYGGSKLAPLWLHPYN